jgi:hypothetical protein
LTREVDEFEDRLASVFKPNATIQQLMTRRKGHATAIGAVARHLAEATYWMLSKAQPYREPAAPPFRPRGISADSA